MRVLWRWSAQLGWRAMVLFGVAVCGLGFGALLKLGPTGEGLGIAGGGVLVLGQALALARACYFELEGRPYVELERQVLAHNLGPLASCYAIVDFLTVNPAWGRMFPLFLVLLGLLGCVSGAQEAISGPGLLHWRGGVVAAASWLLIVVCWTALRFRLGGGPLAVVGRSLGRLLRRGR